MLLFDFLYEVPQNDDPSRRQRRKAGETTVAMHGQQSRIHLKQLQPVALSPSIHTSQRPARSFANRHVILYYSTTLCMHLYSANLA